MGNKLVVSVSDNVNISYGDKEIKNIPIEHRIRKGAYIITCKTLKSYGFSENSFEEAKKDLIEDIKTGFIYGDILKKMLFA
jgi:hypothetical protein